VFIVLKVVYKFQHLPWTSNFACTCVCIFIGYET